MTKRAVVIRVAWAVTFIGACAGNPPGHMGGAGGGGAQATCGPATCGGCCLADGGCVGITSNTSNFASETCGSNGQACIDCTRTNGLCDYGSGGNPVCKPKPAGQRCNCGGLHGCCASGVCVPFIDQSDTQCGDYDHACMACPSTQRCSAGRCVGRKLEG